MSGPTYPTAAQVAALETELLTFTRSVPPPPYTSAAPIAQGNYDFTPAPSGNRPRLPEARRNPYLGDLSDDSCLVKFQTIVRESREIVVGRIKVPTSGPTNHAFILRRYDTDAISLTTMYKVAFPGATDEDEKREMDWVKSTFDTRNMNGSSTCDAVRLAGQWVTRHCAVHIAPSYGLLDLVLALARAAPDPNVAYRKSQRSQSAADDRPVAPVRLGPPVPSMSADTAIEPATKRQRNISPSRDGAGSANDGERHITVEATTTITGPASAHTDMEAEIAQAKQMVVDLRRELQLKSASGQDLEDQGVEVPAERRGKKRVSADADDEVDLSGGSGGKGERIIRKNKKVEEIGGGAGAGQKMAWGVVMFGLGVGATLLPRVVSQIPAFASQFF